MNETTVQNNGQDVEKLDIFALINDFLHSFKRMWIVVLLIIAIVAGAFYYRSASSYSPRYTAEATVSVELVNGGAYANSNTAEQMGLIFPYILTSGVLSDVISADLGMRSVPGSISAKSIKGTNLLTITVSSYDPQLAYKVLQSVLKNYPEVALYVVGQTVLTVVDDSGVPTDTGKTAVVRGSLKKGLLVGAAIGAGLVILRAITLRTVRSESELRSLVNVPYLGTLPECKKKKRRTGSRTDINILYDSNRGEYVDAMRVIRTRLERSLGDKKVLMITSSVAGEGKSTVAANLAISMAQKGKRVILIDCDLRNPSVGRMFDLDGGCPGLSSVLDGSVELDSALYEVLKEGEPTGLMLMPGSDKATRKIEFLSGDAMKKILDRLREKADYIILDTPPSAVLVDAMMLLKHVDGVVYVVMSDFARRRYILKGVEELISGGANIEGCILNGGGSSSGRYGYYGRYGKYGYYGHYGYGHYADEEKEKKH